jgi:hypothetical protein
MWSVTRSLTPASTPDLIRALARVPSAVWIPAFAGMTGKE